MSIVVLLTGLFGLLAAKVLRAAGLESPGLRYPLVVVASYAVLLGLLRLWVSVQRRRGEWHEYADAAADRADAAESALDAAELAADTAELAADATELAADATRVALDASKGVEWPSVGLPGGLDVDLDLDVDVEGIVVVLAVALLATLAALLFFSGSYLVWIAPELLAELLLDCALVGSVYGRLGRRDRRHWLDGALRRTWWLALGTTGFAALAGAFIPRALHGATSLGDVLKQLVERAW